MKNPSDTMFMLRENDLKCEGEREKDSRRRELGEERKREKGVAERIKRGQ